MARAIGNQGSIDVLSASTEEVIGSIPEGTPADVDKPLARPARHSTTAGARPRCAERAEWLRKISGALKERARQIAKTIAQEVGSPITMATPSPGRAAGHGHGVPTRKLITELKLEQEIGNSLVVREPYGVVGAITPWNYPLHQIMAKVAPALAAGCTVVLKPSEVAPLNAFLLAEACQSIGLPGGRAEHRNWIRTSGWRSHRVASDGGHGELHRIGPRRKTRGRAGRRRHPKSHVGTGRQVGFRGAR